MDKRQRLLNIATTFILLSLTAILGASVYYKSYLRLAEACVDFWECCKHYFCFAFHQPIDFVPSITQKSGVIDWLFNWPETWALFKHKTIVYGETLADKQNAIGWLLQEMDRGERVSKIAVMTLPLLVGIVLVIVQLYKRPNNKYNVDTKPLRAFKWCANEVYQPFKRYILGYKAFLARNPKLVALFVIGWCLNLNFGAILVSFIGYYLYFASSFKFTGIFFQFGKLIMDLQVLVLRFPWYLFLPYVWRVFAHWREKRGIDHLQHMEAMNCGFIKELPIVSMVCGSMGKKKTTVLTDMALSQNVMFRQEAYKRLVETDVKFPNFPWIEFERQIKTCMRYKTVYNLATLRDMVRKKEARFNRHWDEHKQLYGYDYRRFGLTYDDKLKVISIFDAMETYGQLYFIYVLQSSLLVSNYSIRDDGQLSDLGNMPMWGNNFFPKTRPRRFHYAHILDFDTIRLGKTVLENNPNVGSFEVGVVTITEVGKERGNTLELKEVKKGAVEANQKNDGFNAWLKMCRHPATVDNYPFVKVFTDEQRPESWGADARDLCEIVNIISTSKSGLALPFFIYEDMLCEWAYNGFGRLYRFMRFNRGDNTLLVYLLKNVTAWLHRYQKRIYNRFGYSVVEIEKERGTMDTKAKECKYYLMDYKIYSNRFATDCFNGYFADKAMRTRIGINDYPEYKGVKATVEELHQQHSYFIEGMYKDEQGGDD